jgi:hypothetical protein
MMAHGTEAFLVEVATFVDTRKTGRLIPAEEAKKIAAEQGIKVEDVYGSCAWYNANRTVINAKGGSVPPITQARQYTMGPTSTHCPSGLHQKSKNVDGTLNDPKPVLCQEHVMPLILNSPYLKYHRGDAQFLANKINEQYYGPTEEVIRIITIQFYEFAEQQGQKSSDHGMTAAAAKIEETEVERHDNLTMTQIAEPLWSLHGTKQQNH